MALTLFLGRRRRVRCQHPLRATALPCAAAAAALLLPALATAYESDVHYGLTRWLALKAGFEPGQAEAIALGDQRVDGGLMDTLAMSPEFACEGRFPDIAREQQQRHFPAAKPVPAPAVEREVQPGGAASREALKALQAMLPGKELLLLAKLGEALHPLQDSWAHRGVPGAPPAWGAMACDGALLSLHGAVHGGPYSHDADLTVAAPEDLLATARATYEALVAYPVLQNVPRKPATFDALKPALERFARAGTKTAKQAWFGEQGFTDTSFLAGISLPDGPRAFTFAWNGRKLPPLTADTSQQHEANVTARAFFDGALARWMGGDKLEAVAADLAGAKAAPELALKLKLWALRDHGSAAPLLHGAWPLRGEALRRAEALTRRPAALVRTGRLSQAVLPFQAQAPYPTPLLPYVTRDLKPSPQGHARAVALLRFLHAPYDTVGLVAEQHEGQWRLLDVVGTPDH